MSLVRSVVRHPVTFLILFIVLTAIGLYTLTSIPIDLFPDVEMPFITVSTTYSGAGPQEIENTITRVLESELSNVSNLSRMRSWSSEGSSRIRLELVYGSDIDEAVSEIRDRLERVGNRLPGDADTPRVFRFDLSASPIIDIAIRGPRSPDDLREIAENQVRARFEQIEGVAEASVQGGRGKSVRVSAIQNRLQAYGVTITQIAQTLSAQNSSLGGGMVSEGERQISIRTTGEFSSIEDIENSVVAWAGSDRRPVLLHEVADVAFEYEEPSQLIYINGEPGVYISVMKASGTNSVAVADAVKREMEAINADLPAGVALMVVNDTTTIIRSSLDQVTSSLLTGAFFAMIVLFVFLRTWRTTVIIGISIPVSVAVTLMAMYFGGLTLNVISLSGLILGIGMVVDASIVVLENIYRYRDRGLGAEEAAVNGTQEMVMAVTSSSITTICVFLPILLFRRGLGVFTPIFTDIAFTVVMAISASLAVSILLVPVLASTYIPLSASGERFKRLRFIKRLDDSFEGAYRFLENAYGRALAVALNYRAATLAVVLAVLLVTSSFIPRIPLVFSPPTAQDSVSANVSLPIGTRLEVTEETMKRIEDALRAEVPGIGHLIVTAGRGGQSNNGRITVQLPPQAERNHTASDVESALRRIASGLPGVRLTLGQGFGAQLSGSTPISVTVRSLDFDRAAEVAMEVQRLMAERFPQITEPAVDIDESLPQIEIVIDRRRASDFGLNISEVTREIRANVQGTTPTHFRSGGNEYSIRISLTPEDRTLIPDLGRIFMRTSTGALIPVSNLAEIRRSSGPVSIMRENRERSVRVTGGLAAGYTPAEVQELLGTAIDESIIRGDDVSIAFTGEMQNIQETGTQFIWITLMAIGLVFAVMASQFESFVSPFIIFFTIPLIAIGVVWIYFLSGTPFSMFSMVGLVMLVGIVVNNGIVLVDYINLLRTRGMQMMEACLEAGRSRLRPILMTTFTTIAGMVPMAFFPGEGAQLTQPVGLTIVGGLASSSVLTLFLIPVLYSIIAARSRVRKIDPVTALAHLPPA